MMRCSTFARHVRHPDRTEMRRCCSERGAAGVEAGFDVGPVVNGDFAGQIKGFAAGELLSVPRRGHVVTCFVADCIHVVLDAKSPALASRGLAPLRQNPAVRCAGIIPYFPKTCNGVKTDCHETVATLDQLYRAKIQEYFG